MTIKIANNLTVFQTTKSSEIKDWYDTARGGMNDAVSKGLDTAGNWLGRQAYEWGNNPRANWATRSGLPVISSVGNLIDAGQNMIGSYGANKAMETARSGVVNKQPPTSIAKGYSDAAKLDVGNKGTIGNNLYRVGTNARINKLFGGTLGPWIAKLWQWVQENLNKWTQTDRVTDRPSTEVVEG